MKFIIYHNITWYNIHTYIHTFIHTYIHPCIHPYIHTYIHAYIHAYIHTYIHTYIFIINWLYTYNIYIYICLFVYFFMICAVIRITPYWMIAALSGPALYEWGIRRACSCDRNWMAVAEHRGIHSLLVEVCPGYGAQKFYDWFGRSVSFPESHCLCLPSGK